MYGTLTQKGQVAIPKAIRDHFGLKPHDKIRFTIHKKKIVAERVPAISDFKGFIHSKRKRPVTEAGMKKTIRDAVVEKFKNKKYI